MKVNVTAQDMEKVGLLNDQHAYHFDCYLQPTSGYKPTPVFRKTAREYKLVCHWCGKVLAE